MKVLNRFCHFKAPLEMVTHCVLGGCLLSHYLLLVISVASHVGLSVKLSIQTWQAVVPQPASEGGKKKKNPSI